MTTFPIALLKVTLVLTLMPKTLLLIWMILAMITRNACFYLQTVCVLTALESVTYVPVPCACNCIL